MIGYGNPGPTGKSPPTWVMNIFVCLVVVPLIPVAMLYSILSPQVGDKT